MNNDLLNVFAACASEKDVDALLSYNLAHLQSGSDAINRCEARFIFAKIMMDTREKIDREERAKKLAMDLAEEADEEAAKP